MKKQKNNSHSNRVKINFTKDNFNMLGSVLEKFKGVCQQNLVDYENNYFFAMSDKLTQKIMKYSYPAKDGSINIFFFENEAAQLIDLLVTFELLYTDGKNLKDYFSEVLKLRQADKSIAFKKRGFEAVDKKL